MTYFVPLTAFRVRLIKPLIKIRARVKMDQEQSTSDPDYSSKFIIFTKNLS
jgi:hypothetical protein